MVPRTRHPSIVRRSSARVRAASLLAFVVLAALGALSGCGGSSATEITITPPVDTSTLAGRWLGSIQSTNFGYSTVVVVLSADSSMTQVAENRNYPALTGTWSVSAAGFTVNARDLNGTIVTLAAPFSKTRLTGTWSGPAVGSATGTFTIAKQP
jgi:hypothetical protein